MDRAMWDRWAPGYGIVFTVLFVVGFIMIGEQPGIGASAEEIASFYTDDRSKLLAVLVIFGLALMAFLAFLGTIVTTLREAGEPRLAATALGAGVVLTSLFTAFLILNGGLAFKIAEDGDAGVVTAIYDLYWVASTLISFPVAAFVAATGIGGLRSRVLPEWFGWASAGAALALLAAGTTWAKDGFWAPDGAYNAYLTPIIFVAWLLTVSVLLLRRPVAAVQPARAVA